MASKVGQDHSFTTLTNDPYADADNLEEEGLIDGIRQMGINDTSGIRKPVVQRPIAQRVVAQIQVDMEVDSQFTKTEAVTEVHTVAIGTLRKRKSDISEDSPLPVVRSPKARRDLKARRAPTPQPTNTKSQKVTAECFAKIVLIEGPQQG